MSDLAALNKRREKPPFQDWKGSVADDKIAASVDNVGKLIDHIVSLGNKPDEEAVRGTEKGSLLIEFR